MRVRATAEGSVHAIEYLSGSCLQLAKRELGLGSPVWQAQHHVLIELNSSRPDAVLREMLASFLAKCLEDTIIIDAALAQSGDQQKHFWRVREEQGEAQKKAGYDGEPPIDSSCYMTIII
jgi:FAD/FMN-containing dehydrogenase